MRRQFDFSILTVDNVPPGTLFPHVQLEDLPELNVNEQLHMFSHLSDLLYSFLSGIVSYRFLADLVFPHIDEEWTPLVYPDVVNHPPRQRHFWDNGVAPYHPIEDSQAAYRHDYQVRRYGHLVDTVNEPLNNLNLHPELPLIQVANLDNQQGGYGCPLYRSLDNKFVGISIFAKKGMGFVLPATFIRSAVETHKIRREEDRLLLEFLEASRVLEPTPSLERDETSSAGEKRKVDEISGGESSQGPTIITRDMVQTIAISTSHGGAKVVRSVDANSRRIRPMTFAGHFGGGERSKGGDLCGGNSRTGNSRKCQDEEDPSFRRKDDHGALEKNLKNEEGRSRHESLSGLNDRHGPSTLRERFWEVIKKSKHNGGSAQSSLGPGKGKRKDAHWNVKGELPDNILNGEISKLGQVSDAATYREFEKEIMERIAEEIQKVIRREGMRREICWVSCNILDAKVKKQDHPKVTLSEMTC